MPNLEVYLKDTSVGALVELLVSELNTDAVKIYSDEIVEIFSFGDIRVTITLGVEDSYSSLYMVGSRIWKSDLELAHFISKSLNTTVRCDPGNNYPKVNPHSDIFVEVYEDKESLVNWI